MGLLDWYRHGPVQDTGKWKESGREYRNMIYENQVDLTIEQSAETVTEGGNLKIKEVEKENISGLEALKTVDEFVREIELEHGIDDVMEEYELRGCDDEKTLTIKGKAPWGYRRYEATFEF